MKLIINGNEHTVTRRLVKSASIDYWGVTPDPGTVTGTVQMVDNDGNLMAEDNADSYSRQSYTGTLLVLTNEPEPVKPEPVETEPTADDVLNALLGVN